MKSKIKYINKILDDKKSIFWNGKKSQKKTRFYASLNVPCHLLYIYLFCLNICLKWIKKNKEEWMKERKNVCECAIFGLCFCWHSRRTNPISLIDCSQRFQCVYKHFVCLPFYEFKCWTRILIWQWRWWWCHHRSSFFSLYLSLLMRKGAQTSEAIRKKSNRKPI